MCAAKKNMAQLQLDVRSKCEGRCEKGLERWGEASPSRAFGGKSPGARPKIDSTGSMLQWPTGAKTVTFSVGTLIKAPTKSGGIPIL